VFGIIPSLIIYIYLGSLAADVSSAISGGGAHAAPPAGARPAVGLGLGVTSVTLLFVYADSKGATAVLCVCWMRLTCINLHSTLTA
jgi:hypothetical protein